MPSVFDRYRPVANDFGLLFGRLLLSGIFLHESVTLSSNFNAAVASMAKLGVPEFVLVVTIAVQLVAGLAIAFGWFARVGALALAGFCLATALLFHNNFALRDEILQFEKDFAIAGGMLVLGVVGAGRISLARLQKRQRPLGPERSAAVDKIH